MENRHQVTDSFFISFSRTSIQHLREMTYRAVRDNLSTSCSKPVILKISSLENRHRQWLRIIPGTWQHFGKKDSKDGYFWYWKSRQKTVQVHHSSSHLHPTLAPLSGPDPDPHMWSDVAAWPDPVPVLTEMPNAPGGAVCSFPDLWRGVVGHILAVQALPWKM